MSSRPAVVPFGVLGLITRRRNKTQPSICALVFGVGWDADSSRCLLALPLLLHKAQITPGSTCLRVKELELSPPVLSVCLQKCPQSELFQPLSVDCNLLLIKVTGQVAGIEPGLVTCPQKSNYS